MGDLVSKILDSTRPDDIINRKKEKKEKEKEKKEKEKASKTKLRKSISEYQKSKSIISLRPGWSSKSMSNSSRQSFYLPSNESMTLLEYDAEIVGPAKLTLDTKKGKSSVYITPSNNASSESLQSETYATTMAKYVPQYQLPGRKRSRNWFGRKSKKRQSHYSSDSSDSDESIRPVYESIYTRPIIQRSLSGKSSPTSRPSELPSASRLTDSLKEILNHGHEMIRVAAHDPDTGFGVRNIIESRLVESSTSTSFTTELKTIKTDGKGHYSFN